MAEPKRPNKEEETQPERLVSMAGPPLSQEAKDRVQARIEAQLESKGGTPVTATASATRTRTVKLAKSDGRGSPAIAAAVMLALMLGLFAMVSPWNRNQPIHETVSGDGDENKESPKPDDSNKGKDTTTAELKMFESPEAAWKGFWDAVETGDAKSWESVLSVKDWDDFNPDWIKKIREKNEAAIQDLREAARETRQAPFEVEFKDKGKSIATFICRKSAWPKQLKIRKSEKGWSFFLEHEDIHRNDCALRLKQLGIALNLYESVPAYNCFPPALEILFRDYVADHRCFLCPSVKDGEHVASPKWFTSSKGGPNMLEANDYLYIPGQDSSSGEGVNIVAFCRCGNHRGEGSNVLLTSGAVEWQDKATRNKNILATLQKLKISIELPARPKADLTPEETARIKQAIEDLGSPAYNVRERASKQLSAAGPRASELLDEGVKSDDPERAKSCRRILASFDIPVERRYWIESIRRELELDAPEKPVDVRNDFGPEADLRLKIEISPVRKSNTEKPLFAPGEKIAITTTLKNVSKDTVYDLPHYNYFAAYAKFVVKDENGHELPMTKEGEESVKLENVRKGILMPDNVIAPNVTIQSLGLDISKLFDLSKPGTYTLQVIYEDKPDADQKLKDKVWSGKLVSNICSFIVAVKQQK